jgi:hypothetical protein
VTLREQESDDGDHGKRDRRRQQDTPPRLAGTGVLTAE